MKPYLKLKRVWALLICIAIYCGLASCSTTRIILQTAPSTPKGAAAIPVISPVNQEIWERQTIDEIKNKFATQIYGQFPKTLTLREIKDYPVAGLFFNDKAKINITALRLKNEANQQEADFDLLLMSPKQTGPTKAVIVMQSFCPIENIVDDLTFPITRERDFNCKTKGAITTLFKFVFGRYIIRPPIEMIVEKGYALAILYPSDFIPDAPEKGVETINSFFSDQEPTTRTRTLMAWAKQLALVADYLETERGFEKSITYGHSRYGKTALIAAAFDSEIDAVVGHQSGTGGASLNRDKEGESVDDIKASYPHWFLEQYTDSPKGIDQHHLLALLAPRPVLLSNAKRDVWSDPEGAFRAAQGANPVYELYGTPGLTANKLTQFIPADSISYWIRPGTHGIVKEDWPAFLEFIDAHFLQSDG